MCTSVMRVYKCSLKYPACTAHAPYYIVVCGLPGSTIYFHNIPKSNIFENKVIEHKTSILIFSTAFAWNSFHSKKKWAKHDQKCILGCTWSARYFCLILMRNEFSKNIQISNFTNIRLVGAELFHADRWTHGWTEMTKLIVAIRNFANVRKKKESKLFRSSCCMWAFLYLCEIPQF